MVFLKIQSENYLHWNHLVYFKCRFLGAILDLFKIALAKINILNKPVIFFQDYKDISLRTTALTPFSGHLSFLPSP